MSGPTPISSSFLVTDRPGRPAPGTSAIPESIERAAPRETNPIDPTPIRSNEPECRIVPRRHEPNSKERDETDQSQLPNLGDVGTNPIATASGFTSPNQAWYRTEKLGADADYGIWGSHGRPTQRKPGRRGRLLTERTRLEAPGSDGTNPIRDDLVRRNEPDSSRDRLTERTLFGPSAWFPTTRPRSTWNAQDRVGG
jgi:hypothetical protein